MQGEGMHYFNTITAQMGARETASRISFQTTVQMYTPPAVSDSYASSRFQAEPCLPAMDRRPQPSRRLTCCLARVFVL